MSNWLSSGRRTNKRRARNFSHETAQKRLDETIRPFHDQVENALNVDSVEAIVYKKSVTGRPCTCSKAPVSEQLDHDGSGENPDLAAQGTEANGTGFRMAQGDDIFGEADYQSGVQVGVDESRFERKSRELEAADILSGNSGFGSDGADEQDGMIPGFEENLFSGGVVNCGICFSRGITPAYQPVNHTLYTLTNYHLTEVQGYNVDFSQKPAQITSLHEDSYAKFTINVPKYFKEVKFAIRDNLQTISRAFLYIINGGGEFERLTTSHLDAVRGKAINIYVRGEDFTHVTVFFRHNVNPILVNISEEAETLDYTMETTLGQITVIAPEKIGHVTNSDILVIPKRNLVLKVTDAPRKSTAKRTIIEWSLTTRALQPQEALRMLNTGYKVY